MRGARLGRQFDAVLLHDAVDYMLGEDDLLAVFETAWHYCRPGGAVVAIPDHVRETFTPTTETSGADAPDGSGVRYLEWSTNPDPSDTRIDNEYAFVIREADGRVTHCHERHETGCSLSIPGPGSCRSAASPRTACAKRRPTRARRESPFSPIDPDADAGDGAAHLRVAGDGPLAAGPVPASTECPGSGVIVAG